jgi:hypothetical protein
MVVEIQVVEELVIQEVEVDLEVLVKHNKHQVVVVVVMVQQVQ